MSLMLVLLLLISGILLLMPGCSRYFEDIIADVGVLLPIISGILLLISGCCCP